MATIMYPPDQRQLSELVLEDNIDEDPIDTILDDVKDPRTTDHLYFNHLNPTQQGLVSDAIEMTQNPQFRGLLFHLPMGSGKTRTGLITGLNLYDQFLVICSKTLIPNWIDELNKVFGHQQFQYEVVHRDYLGSGLDTWTPSPRSRIIFTTPETVLKSYKENGIEDHFVDVQVNPKKTYYYSLPQERPFITRTLDISGPGLLHSIAWKGIFVDECQNFTNALTSTCRAVASLYTPHRWLLSGTPLQEPKSERLLGFFLLLNYPKPNSLPEMNYWLKSGTYTGIKNYSLSCPPPEIKATLHTHEHIYQMTPSEVMIFAFFREIIIRWFDYYERMKVQLPPKSPVLNKIRGHLLSLLTYTRIGIVAPKKAIQVLVEKISREPFLKGLDEELEGLKSAIEEATEHSSRLAFLYDILTQKIDEQVIVFSNFVVTLDAAREYLMKQPHLKGRTYYILNNSLSTPQRASVLNDFRQDQNGVLFMTYAMGSEGLNLQSTCCVIFLDCYWNTAKEQQAVARAYRIGQTRDVSQHYLISNTQFEHSLLMKQIGKTKLLSEFLDGSQFINPRVKAGGISYKEMVQLIQSEDVKRLLDSGERFVPKPHGEGVLSEPPTPTRTDDPDADTLPVLQ